MIDDDTLRSEFERRFGAPPRLFRAPGRVNLIGEHTDYNEGFVLPMALEMAAHVAAAPREDRLVVAHAVLYGETATFDLDVPGEKRRGSWLDYVEGVARTLEARGTRLGGANLVVSSDVPVGAGLSSSAALEVATGLALASVSNAAPGEIELALAGQAAEHEYVGTRVGIMDQLTSALGRAGHALLIDCRSLEATPIPLRFDSHDIVVCDSHVSHNLASSEYNLRREQCERGVELFGEWLPGIRSLRDVGVDDFARLEGQLPEPVRRRCRHVVTENARTLAAADALARGDAAAAGALMLRSHESLRVDYEVSCRELDILVDAALGVAGVAGARMTGGGFGGCTVNLVARDAVERFLTTVTSTYERQVGREPTCYVVRAGDGAREVT
jgi:galactokinase